MSDAFLTSSDRRSRVYFKAPKAMPQRAQIGFKFPAKVNPQDIKVFDRKIDVINKKKFKMGSNYKKEDDFFGTLKLKTNRDV